MTEEQFNQWVEALESGEYEQYRGTLVDSYEKPTKFCCLGVLSKEFNVVQVNGWISYPKQLVSEYQQTMCVDWNDVDKYSFAKIAQKLREKKESFVEVAN